jgi:hypothetical protein
MFEQSPATHFFPFLSSRLKVALLGALYDIEQARRGARRKETVKLHSSVLNPEKSRNRTTKCQAACRVLCVESNSKFILGLSLILLAKRTARACASPKERRIVALVPSTTSLEHGRKYLREFT